MTKEEFIDSLCRVVGINTLYTTDWKKRKVIITITRANYGTPSSAVIEFEGSPARFPIFMGDLSYGRQSRTLCVNGKFIRGIKAKENACEVIDEFLRLNNAL